jgi:hypothetical protein
MYSAFSNSHSRLAIAEHTLGLNTQLADIAQKLWSSLFEKLLRRIRLIVIPVVSSGGKQLLFTNYLRRNTVNGKHLSFSKAAPLT